MSWATRPADLDAPGHPIKGGELEAVLDALAVLYDPWVTQVTDATALPTWAASAGTPAIGDGGFTAGYQKTGNTVRWRWHITAGTTTTFGTAGAFFTFTIPGGGIANETFIGAGWFFDSSAGANYPLEWKIDSGATTMRLWRVDASPAVELLNNTPVTMATSDQLMANGVIEIT